MPRMAEATRPGAGVGRALVALDLIIFDCDGVLIDSEPIASRTLASALAAAGIEIDAQEAHRRFTGHSEPAIRQMCLALGLRDPDAVFLGWHEAIYAEFARALRPMPGMTELVAALDRPKCVASNSTLARLRRSLGLLPLWQSFAPAIYSAEMVARPKPAPDLPRHCAQAFGARPERCVMIDDSPHGIKATVAAGMIAIGFVDPADPRPGRAQVLRDAGAWAVVQGAAELGPCLEAADQFLGRTLGPASPLRRAIGGE